MTNYHFQTNETTYARDLNKIIHEKHSNVLSNLTIPVVFIDPVIHIFKDPCDSRTNPVSSTEKEKFHTYVSE